MPIKGLILIVVLALIVAIVERERIYEWLTSETSDDNYKNDDDNSEEEQKE